MKKKTATKITRVLYVNLKQSMRYKILDMRYLKIWDIHLYFLRGLTVLVWNRNAFSQSRMAAFQTCDKINN